MKRKREFIESIKTLLYSWGSDTPPEAIWGLNELIDWFEKEYNTKIKHRFAELDEEDDIYTEDYDLVIEELECD